MKRAKGLAKIAFIPMPQKWQKKSGFQNPLS
jgi:hypothetical protein